MAVLPYLVQERGVFYSYDYYKPFYEVKKLLASPLGFLLSRILHDTLLRKGVIEGLASRQEDFTCCHPFLGK